MSIKRVTILVGIAALVLTGCMRQSALYELNPNGTVDARIAIAIHEDYSDPGEPYRNVPVEEILDHFSTDTISENDFSDWIGYEIYLDDEPLASFADPAEASWDLQILSEGPTWAVYGMEYDSEDDAFRQMVLDNDGYLTLAMTFPGDLVEWEGTAWYNLSDPGVAQWDMAIITVQPYARGEKPFIGPPPDPDPPDPAITIVITPDPPADPIVTPEVTPTPTATATTADTSPPPAEKSDGIPPWVWAVGAGLVAALVGVLSYVVANKPKAGTGAKAEPKESKAPEAKPKEKKPKGD